MSKPEERAEARRRRSEGASIVAIARDLAVSRASVSVWVRDVPLPAVDDDAPPASPTALPTGTRRCGRCEQRLSVSAFNRAGDGLQHWCRDCFKTYQRTRRDRNRAQVAAATRRRRSRARAHVLRHLEGATCADCGEGDLVVLEFDHVRGQKHDNLSMLVSSGRPLRRIDAELAKCEVVCASCHRMRTAMRAGSYRVLGERCASWPQKTPSQKRAMTYVAARLRGRACIDCGDHRLPCLDFDHRGGKTASVSTLVCDGAANERLAAEIAKCDVRCASCHRRRTEWARTSWRTQIEL